MARITEKQEYPKGSGITFRPVNNITLGKVYGVSFEVLLPAKITGGKRLRKRFPNVDEAKRFAKAEWDGYRQDGQSFFKLTTRERQELGHWVPLLRERNISIAQAISYAVSHLESLQTEKTLGEVVDAQIADKRELLENGHLRERSLKDFRSRAGRLKRDLGDKLLREVSKDDIAEWINSIEGQPRTKKNHLLIASEVFKTATEQQLISTTPIKFTKSERKLMIGNIVTSIGILTLTQAEAFINYVASEAPEWLGMVTLGLFAGIRTEELLRLEWDAVRMDEGVVMIDDSIAKKRRIRFVDIQSNAMKWLMLVKDRTGRVAPHTGKSFERRFMALRIKAGFVDAEGTSTWPQNAMRHSFGSYFYAKTQDDKETSRLMGHIESEVLFNNYRKLAKKAEGEAYFNIVPGGSGKRVVEFKEAQA